MKSYIWDYLPFVVEANLPLLVRTSLKDELAFSRCWTSTDNVSATGAREVALKPGQAIYFLGGRLSLPAALHEYSRFTVKTSCGSGLVLVARTKIKVSDADRFSGFLKSKLPIHTGSRYVREVKHEFNELRRRTLTCVCLHNASLDGAVPPDATSVDRLIGPDVTLQEVGRRLAEFFNNRRADEAQQRQGAVAGLMRDLLID